MLPADTSTEEDPDRDGAARIENLEALLDELKAASKLMDDIAAAADLLPTPYRRKADALGRNLMQLYQTGKRSAGAGADPVNPAER